MLGSMQVLSSYVTLVYNITVYNITQGIAANTYMYIQVTASVMTLLQASCKQCCTVK